MTTDNLTNVNVFNKFGKSHSNNAASKNKADGQKPDSLEILAKAKNFTNHLDSSIEKAEIARRSERADERRTIGQERAEDVHKRNKTRKEERNEVKTADRNQREENRAETDKATTPNSDVNSEKQNKADAGTSSTEDQTSAANKQDDDNANSADEKETASKGDENTDNATASLNSGEQKDTLSNLSETGENESLLDETIEVIDDETNAIAAANEFSNKAPTSLDQEDGIETGAIGNAVKSDKPKTTNPDEALKNAANGNGAKAEEGLESTLGQDENGKTKKSSNSKSSELTELAKTLKETSPQKDGTQFIAGQQGQLHSANPLTANGTPGKPGLTPASFGLGGQDAALTTTDQPDALTGNAGGVDGKANPATSQLRAAGYTSPTQSLAIQIAQKAQNGAQQFEIRMNPPELGRVDVRLDFSKEGQVSTHLIVERPETLEMLTRDSRQLEKALEQAGLNLDSDSLTFSLKEDGDTSARQNQFDFETEGEGHQGVSGEDDIESNNAIYRRIAPPNGIDISI